MTEQTIPVRAAHFEDLAARCPGTAAAHLPLVIWTDDFRKPADPVAYRHQDFLSLYLVRRGRGTHVINGVPFGIARGDVYAMGVGMTRYFADCDDLILETLHFAPDIFGPEALDALAGTPGFRSLFVEEPLHRVHRVHRAAGCAGPGASGRWLHLPPDAFDAVATELAELRSEWEVGTPEGTLLTHGLFLRLLIHLARRYAQSPQRQGEAPSVSRATTAATTATGATVAAAVRYLDTHFADPIRIEQVAASVFLSPDRFTHVFAATMGRTPRDYLRHLRIEHAQALLATTDAPIAHVAVRSGFGDAAYFTRVFRAAMGTTPRRFRQEARILTAETPPSR